MKLFGFLKKKQKIKKKRSTSKATKKTQKSTTQVKVVEDPLITVSRQLTLIQETLNQINVNMSSGFESLREDHHRIVEEQISKKDVLLDVDKEILDLLGEGELQSVSVAEKIGLTRQYASKRLTTLKKLGYLTSIKKGRKIYYKLKK